MLLRVEHVSKSFGGVAAVRDISFEVGQGELVAIIGPNGAGKSTTFNMVGGQLRPDAGRVTFADRNITGLSPRQIYRLGIGRTFQIAQAFLSMSVAENVQVTLASALRQSSNPWRALAGSNRERIHAILSQIGLQNLASSRVSELAYADIKRVELALALASKPKLLLMDEPTAGMAPDERASLMRLVEKLASEERIGVLFTEHDMDSVFGHANRIIVLVRGEIIAAGAPSDIRRDEKVRDAYLGHSLEAFA